MKYAVDVTFEIEAKNKDEAWKIINDLANLGANMKETKNYNNFVQVYHVDEPMEEQ